MITPGAHLCCWSLHFCFLWAAWENASCIFPRIFTSFHRRAAGWEPGRQLKSVLCHHWRWLRNGRDVELPPSWERSRMGWPQGQQCVTEVAGMWNLGLVIVSSPVQCLAPWAVGQLKLFWTAGHWDNVALSLAACMPAFSQVFFVFGSSHKHPQNTSDSWRCFLGNIWGFKNRFVELQIFPFPTGDLSAGGPDIVCHPKASALYLRGAMATTGSDCFE